MRRDARFCVSTHGAKYRHLKPWTNSKACFASRAHATPTWDYGSNAAYFVTICTQHRIHYFGAIAASEMPSNQLGVAAQTCWDAIPLHFPFVILDTFIVMPNHVHGILIINKPNIEGGNQAVPSAQSPETCSNKFAPQSQNLASIVRGFKVGVTKIASQYSIPFSWQSRYHDYIVRTDHELSAVRQYFINNPRRWTEDDFFAGS